MDTNEFTAKVKKNFTMKKAIKTLTIVGGLLLIVFMTVVNVTLDPRNINLKTYATNAMIMVGIMVFGLVMGESVGEDRQTEKSGGLYQTNLGLFFEAKEAISPIEIYFEQFYLWFKEKQTYSKRIDYLVDNGFDTLWAKAIIDCVELSDVDKLTKETLCYEKGGKKIYVKRVAPEQADAVKKALNGSIRIDAPSYAYYLSAHSHANKRYILEQQKELERSIKINKGANRGLKIITSLAISAIWAMMTVQDFMDGGSGQAWLNLVSRLTSFVTSFSSGWGTSVINVKLMAQMLENKASVLKYFKDCTDKKEFTPQTYEEEAKAIWEKEEKAREDAKVNTIDAVPVPNLEVPLITQKDEILK